jgi:heme/copper-type cytochrome/quinol oxidase subunit 4
MRHHLRLVAILAVALITYGVLVQAFRLISAPSDRALYAGVAIVFGLLFLVPAIVRTIWRKL